MLLIFGEIMEIERKISVMKLYGIFKKEDVEKSMEEVEEEWGLY